METKRLVNNIHGDKALKMRTIYKILKQIKAGKNTTNRRKFNLKKIVQTATLIAAVTANVEADCMICMNSLASAHGTSVGTLFSILHKDL